MVGSKIRQTSSPDVITADSNSHFRRPRSRTLLNVALFVFFLAAFLETAVFAYHGYVLNRASTAGDWLINYQGGFVRRGLTGEVFFDLSSWTGIPPGAYAAATQVACYFVYFLFAGLLLSKQQRPLQYILLTLSPFIFLFQVHDPEGGFRKEVIYFALLAFYAWSSLRMSKAGFERSTVVVLVSYPLLILSHEVLAVFLPYVVAVYVSRSPLSARSLAKLTGLLSISIIAFIATVMHSGDSTQVSAICNSLAGYAPKHCEQAGAISYLHHGLSDALRYVHRAVVHDAYFLNYSIVILLCSIAYLPVRNKLKTIVRNKYLIGLVAVSALGSLPVFFIGIDWGRWIYIHLVSLFLLTLVVNSANSPQSKPLEQVTRGMLLMVGNADGKTTKFVVRALGILLALLFVLGYASLWRIPHCCDANWARHHLPSIWPN